MSEEHKPVEIQIWTIRANSPEWRHYFQRGCCPNLIPSVPFNGLQIYDGEKWLSIELIVANKEGVRIDAITGRKI